MANCRFRCAFSDQIVSRCDGYVKLLNLHGVVLHSRPGNTASLRSYNHPLVRPPRRHGTLGQRGPQESCEARSAEVTSPFPLPLVGPTTDFSQNPFQILHHFPIFKPHDAQSQTHQIGRSLFVPLPGSFAIVD